MNHVGVRPRFILLFCVLTATFSGPGQVYSIAVIVPHLRQALDLSRTQLAFLFAIASLSSGFLLPWAGKSLDRIRPGTFTLFGITLVGVGCLLLSASTGMISALLGLFCLRAGGPGALSLAASVTASRRFTKYRGTALSLTGLGHTFSEALLPMWLLFLIHHLDWREALMFTGIGSLAIYGTLAFLFSQRDRETLIQSQIPLSKEEKSVHVKELLKDKLFYLLLAPALVPPLVCTSFFYHQAALSKLKGWPEGTLALAFTSYAVFRALSSTFIGSLLDRAPWIRSLYGPHLLTFVAGVIAFLFLQDSWGGSVYLGCLGMGVGLNGILQSVLWVETYGTKNIGSVAGLIGTFSIIVTALGPLFVGILLDLGLPLNALLITVTALTLVCMGCGIQGLKIVRSQQRRGTDTSDDTQAPPSEEKTAA